MSKDLIKLYPHLTPAMIKAVEMWADARTDVGSDRRHDLLRDKRNALLSDGEAGSAAGFFTFIPKSVDQVTPDDVRQWQAYLEDMGLSGSSVYARISRLSSFYNWLIDDPYFRGHITYNPVDLARPKAPKAYQNDKARALSDEDARRLLLHVRSEAAKGDVNAKRDYALLRFYFATGKRRAEIIRLEWGDLEFSEEAIVIHTEEKGGLYQSTEVRDPGVLVALLDYIKASGRWDGLNNVPLIEPDDPLWLRHDRAAKGYQPVTSHGFVKALKRYAKACGIGHIHLHQTRHTVARLVGEHAGDLSEVQAVLGHQNIATTRIYLSRVTVKKDRYSRKIAGRLGLVDDDDKGDRDGDRGDDARDT